MTPPLYSLIFIVTGLGGLPKDEVVGSWRKLHNEGLHNLYSSPSIIRMIKSRRMRWAGHVARMSSKGMYIGFLWKIKKEMDTT
jgi:hypothetical protein